MSKVVPDLRTEAKPHIRWMVRCDMPQVLKIEHASYRSPWSEEDFEEVLRQRNCIGMVIEMGDDIVGYVIYELHKRRISITNLAVHPAYRREGMSMHMVSKIVKKLSSQRNRVSVELRESNLVAQLFFKSAGFLASQIVRGYYEDTNEDAYVMEFITPPNEEW